MTEGANMQVKVPCMVLWNFTNKFMDFQESRGCAWDCVHEVRRKMMRKKKKKKGEGTQGHSTAAPCTVPGLVLSVLVLQSIDVCNTE